MKKILLGSLLVLGLCATSYQPAEARAAANVVAAVGNGAEKAIVATGAATTLIASVLVDILITKLAYGTVRTVEEALAFTWNHKAAITFTATVAYATYITMVTGLDNNGALALVLQHKDFVVAHALQIWEATKTNASWLKDMTIEFGKKFKTTSTIAQ